MTEPTEPSGMTPANHANTAELVATVRDALNDQYADALNPCYPTAALAALDALQTQAETAAANNTAKANIEYIARLTKRAEAAEAERDRWKQREQDAKAREEQLRAERDHARDALRQYDEAFTAARGSIAFYMGPNARVGVSRQTIAMFTALADASVVARAALGEDT